MKADQDELDAKIFEKKKDQIAGTNQGFMRSKTFQTFAR